MSLVEIFCFRRKWMIFKEEQKRLKSIFLSDNKVKGKLLSLNSSFKIGCCSILDCPLHFYQL